LITVTWRKENRKLVEFSAGGVGLLSAGPHAASRHHRSTDGERKVPPTGGGAAAQAGALPLQALGVCKAGFWEKYCTSNAKGTKYKLEFQKEQRASNGFEEIFVLSGSWQFSTLCSRATKPQKGGWQMQSKGLGCEGESSIR